MCGIFAVIGSTIPREQLEQVVRDNTEKLKHRGPDELLTYVSPDGWCGLGFARLAICDPEHGHQPMKNDSQTVWGVTNGEIYNHKDLRTSELDGISLHSNMDCEVIPPLYEKYATSLFPHDISHLFNTLKGVFASVTVDLERGQFIAARDPIGVRAMFMGRSSDGAVWFASEAKALLVHCTQVEPFQPGNYYAAKRGAEATSSFKPYYSPLHYNPGWVPSQRVDLQKLHDSFVTSCTRRLMSDVPIGVFISGGLDSSLVASIAKKNLPADYVFHSFSCGLEGSPDIAAAQKVADFLGTEHHVLTFTIEQGIEALRNVIYHLETFDVTTIRASTPMYLLSELCQKYVKVVLSGEGADEVFGGYLYFHNAETEEDFYKETVRRVKLLYTADVLRGDRSTAAHSLELRVPFLDRDFLDVAMSFSAADKVTHKGGRIEKWAMRHAFSQEFCGTEYLPDDILMRPKEQFSDGVGYSWVDALKDHCDDMVTDKMMMAAAETFPYKTPKTKEAFFYRMLWEERFCAYQCAQSMREGIELWVPRWSKNEDPSGRAQDFHAAAYSKTCNGNH